MTPWSKKKTDKIFGRNFGSFICISSLFLSIVFYYCVIENMQHVLLCTWLDALLALVVSGLPLPPVTNWTSYCYEDFFSPLYIVCMRAMTRQWSKHVNNLCMIHKSPRCEAWSFSPIQLTNSSSKYCTLLFRSSSTSYLLHVARHFGSRVKTGV